MSGETDPPPDDVLKDMVYLARSENRIRILEALVRQSRSPREISEDIDVSRSSLRRILTELVEQGWAERSLDGDYVATPIGEQVAVETGRYLRAIQAIRTLGPAISWLPIDDLTVGLEYFQTATIIGPERNAAVAPDTYAADKLRSATEFRNLVNIAPTLGFETVLHEGVATGSLTAEHVVTEGVLSHLRQHGERRDRWRRYLESGATMYRYEDRIPCNLFIMDRTVFIAQRQVEGLRYIEVENEAVHTWARSLYEKYRMDAEPLGSSVFH